MGTTAAAVAIPGLRCCPPPAPALHTAILARLTHGLEIVRAQPRFGGFPQPRVIFFNRRTAAGLALFEHWALALNRGLFERYPEENLRETVLHELAHLTVGYARKQRLIKGRVAAHGPEWRQIMQQWFGVEPERTHKQETDHLHIRRQRRWEYLCGCQAWQISTVRHNRIHHQGREYRCLRCGDALVHAGRVSP
ncbi:MAG: SprT-like domain-containing protein [Pseudomonadales bacterium]